MEKINNNKKESILKVICYIIFIIYILCLTKIVLFKYSNLMHVIKDIFKGELSGFRSVNIIPLKSIIDFIKIISEGYFTRGFNNIIGNILVFVPLGYFLPMLFKKTEKVRYTILFSLILSLIYESLQYFLYLGSADIDDVILNLLGAFIGFIFYKIIENHTMEKVINKYYLTIIISIIGFIVAGYLAVDYFGIMFGIRNKNNAYNNDVNNINESLENDKVMISPDNEFDIWGDIISFDDESITINKTKIIDLENGAGIAISDMQNMDLKTIYLLSSTRYTVKDIYDANGEKVEIKTGAKENLKIDKHINVKGYVLEDKMYGAEIIINNYLFM